MDLVDAGRLPAELASLRRLAAALVAAIDQLLDELSPVIVDLTLTVVAVEEQP